MILWRDGRWIDADQPLIAAADRGFTLGDGLFETMLWNGTGVERLERHLERLCASARALDLSYAGDVGALAAILPELAIANGFARTRAAIKVTLSATDRGRGLERASPAASLMAMVAPSALPSAPFRLASVSVRRNETAPSARYKTLSYIDQIDARREARALGADEAVQRNLAGDLAGAAAGNLVVVIGGRALTPRLSDGALAGTVRAELLAKDMVTACAIGPDIAGSVEAMAVTNALIGVHPVARWDDRDLDPDHIVVRALRTSLGA